MLLADASPWIAYGLPAFATVLVAAIGAYVTISGRRRESRVVDVYARIRDREQQLESKTALIDSLREQVTDMRDQFKNCKERLAEVSKRLDGK